MKTKLFLSLLFSLVLITGTKAQTVYATKALNGGAETAITISANAEYMVVASDAFSGGSEVKVEKFHFNTSTEEYNKVTSYSLYEAGSSGASVSTRGSEISNSGNVFIYYQNGWVSGEARFILNKNGDNDILTTFGSFSVQSMQIINGYLYMMLQATATDYRFYKIDESTGQVVWMRTDVESGRKILPYGNDLLVAYNNDGRLDRFSTSDGSYIENVKQGDPGEFYEIGQDGNLIAIKAQSIPDHGLKFNGIDTTTFVATNFQYKLWGGELKSLKTESGRLFIDTNRGTVVLDENTMDYLYSDNYLEEVTNYSFQQLYSQITGNGKVCVYKYLSSAPITVYGINLVEDDKIILNIIQGVEDLSIIPTIDSSYEHIISIEDGVYDEGLNSWKNTNNPRIKTIVWEDGYLPTLGERADYFMTIPASGMSKYLNTDVKIDSNNNQRFFVASHMHSNPGYTDFSALKVYNLEQSTVGIDDYNISDELVLYPNPARDIINFKFGDLTQLEKTTS